MRFIWILIILTVILRIYCIGLESFHIDMSSWQAWSGRLVDVGPANFYSPGYFADYFPGYLYILLVLGKIFSVFTSVNQIYGIGFDHFLKLSTNLFDFASAFLIYKIISKKNRTAALTASLFYLASPALIFNSSVWGQVDGVLNFFLLLTAYSLLNLRRPLLWGILSGISFIVKPQGLPALFILLISFFKTFSFKKYWAALAAPIAAVILSIPFFITDPILGLPHLALKSSNVYPFTSMFAYNFWELAGWWVPDKIKFLYFSYEQWGIILFIASLLIITFPIFKKKKIDEKNLYLAAGLSLFSLFLFLTRIHERYLIYSFPFLIIFICLKKNILYSLFFILLSLIHFLNLWYVYFYYSFVFKDPSLASQPIFALLTKQASNLSLITLALFLIFLGIYYQEVFRNEAT